MATNESTIIQLDSEGRSEHGNCQIYQLRGPIREVREVRDRRYVRDDG